MIESKEYSKEAKRLHEVLHAHLTKQGFSKLDNGYTLEGGLTKQRIRDIYSVKRQEILLKNEDFIEKYSPSLIDNFASGAEIDPSRISPELIEVRPNSLEARLFRFASLIWSVPVSQGFGRRIRFLVRDRQNNKLIGLLAIGDPVFNLSARDNWVGWSFNDRKERLVHLMDAYVVGAVPPYSQILGGKLVASLLGSKEVQKVYERKYVGLKSVIGKKKNQAQLVMLTTTSSMGRSSLYNRLKIPNGPKFIRIGETRGYGHFHLSGDPYTSGYEYGMGPNWRMRVARAALESLGVDTESILNHGISREVYAIPLAKNWRDILDGVSTKADSTAIDLKEIVEYCLNRWVLPRAGRRDEYKEFTPKKITEHLENGSSKGNW